MISVSFLCVGMYHGLWVFSYPGVRVWLPLQGETWDVERKDDNSPLTRADKEANAIICAGLAAIGRFVIWLVD